VQHFYLEPVKLHEDGWQKQKEANDYEQQNKRQHPLEPFCIRNAGD
jgi:hypothetical protein